MAIGKILLVCLAMNCFFVSVKLMGAFKDLGSGLGEELIMDLASNPLIGLLIGILVTSIAQSSSMTTSLVVGLVAGGAMGDDPVQALYMAIPIILGANVGTTVTNMLVSMAHIDNKIEFERAFSSAVVHDFFNVIAITLFLPLQIFTNFLGHFSLFLARLFENTGGMKFVSPLKLLVDPQKEFIHDLFQKMEWITVLLLFVMLLLFVFSLNFLHRRLEEKKAGFAFVLLFCLIFALLGTAVIRHSGSVFQPEVAVFVLGIAMLFASLVVFVKVMRSAVLTSWEVLFHNYIFKTAIRAMLLGAVITATVQSSSVTTSIIVPLAGAGILTIRQVFPYTLGANVGTTITAILAAMSTGEMIAMAVAFAHLSFNILGIIVLYPLRRIPIACAEGIASLSVKWRAVPVIFIIMFIAIPVILILLTR